MLRFILKRLLQAIPLLLGIATITFAMVHLAPGDPMDMYMEQRFQREVDPQVIELLRKKYGLDQPLPVQYAKWIGNVAQGDLGESFRYRRPVTSLIAERVPYTLQLAVLALFFDALIGIALGIISAVRQYSRTDRAITVGSLVMYSIPGFWLALMLVLVFSVNLNWFPTSQTRSLDYELLSLPGKVLDRLWHLALPVFVLGVASAAGTARFMRNKLLDVLSEEYVVGARARGLSERAVILQHALRNALIPIVTIYGLALPFLLGGAVLIEKVFAWPGMGLLAVEAIGARDYPVILATSMIAAVLVVVGNLFADVTYALVDPRVSYGGKRLA
ncbi:MAG TPA: ABC transporter permease [Gemmatimonadaceae bacterium]|nr:ABC transporter permease [Gemmatimonadaceae bacterium]